MPLDRETRRALRKSENRKLDFNPDIQSVIPVADTDKKGVDNAHVLLSASTNYHLILEINGVPFRVALTSAF